MGTHEYMEPSISRSYVPKTIVKQRNRVSSSTRCEFRWYGLCVVTALAHDTSVSALCMSMQCSHAEGIEILKAGESNVKYGRGNMGSIENFHQIHCLVSLRCTMQSLFWHRTIHEPKGISTWSRVVCGQLSIYANLINCRCQIWHVQLKWNSVFSCASCPLYSPKMGLEIDWVCGWEVALLQESIPNTSAEISTTLSRIHIPAGHDTRWRRNQSFEVASMISFKPSHIMCVVSWMEVPSKLVIFWVRDKQES